jgi:glycosyltransferase involved in cell wall biosynthesis
MYTVSMKYTVLKSKILISANTSWYLYNFRLPLLRELVSRGCKVHALAPHDSYAEKLEEISIEHIPINITRSGLNPFADIALFSQFLSIYRRLKPDIVQHFTVKPVIYGTLAAHVCRVPHIFNMVPGMGYVFTGTNIKKFWVQKVVRLLYKSTLNFSQHVFFQNQDDRDYFLRYSLVDPGITSIVSGTGVDTEKFHPTRKNKKGGITFVMAARMLWDKGVGEYVEAARIVKSKYPNSQFWMLGPVDMENPKGIKLEQLQAWNGEGVVRYFGMTDSIKTYLSEADVIVLPSYYREGIPLSLLEGAAMGMPIITTDSPGCREVVMKGQRQNGFLIPIKDPQALAAAMEQLTKNPALVSKMGKESRNLVKRKFDSKIVVKEILHYYPI